MFPLVSITLFLPLAGVLVLLLLPAASPRLAHTAGIATAGLTLAGAAGLWARGTSGTFSQVEELNWIPSLGVAYRVGIDGISLPLVFVSAVLFLAALIFSLRITERPRTYVAFFLFLETACLGVFVALDMLLFYVFFELTLVGMYFIIAGWGHEGRQRAALMFFLYTLLGSLPLLLAILALYLGGNPRTFDMRAVIGAPPLAGLAATLTFVAFAITFAVKSPLFPLHTWLPAAHVEAPTAGSVILAGVLLKLGTYGFVRFALQMTPQAFRAAALPMAIIAVISALYGAFLALAQTDLKRMVAYTSVNHMGYVVLAVSAAAAATGQATKALAIDGAVLQMVSHALVTGSLFLIVGALQDRAGTRDMRQLGGLLAVAPRLSWAFILAAFASLGLPGLAHFPAEFQIFLGAFGVWPAAAAIAVIGIVITAGLYLRAIQTAFMGPPAERWKTLPDLDRTDLWSIVPLLGLIVAVGVASGAILNVIHLTSAGLR